VTMRLTLRGAAVAVGSLVLLGVGEWVGYPLFRVLAAIGLTAVLAAIVVTARGLRVEVAREVHPDRVERGRPALAKLRVRNTARWRQRGFFASDRAGGGARTVPVRALAPGAEAVHRYEVPTAIRGRMPVGPLVLHRTDPFGLARNRLTAGDTATLWVHPRTYPASARIGGFPRHHYEGRATQDKLRGSLDVRDVREYQPGDEVRTMHWKATARTGRLMVRDAADPDQPRFTVLLDTRATALPPVVFEEAVDVAASLLASSALAGHHSRLVTSGGGDLATAGGPLAARLLLDELCLLRQDSDGAVLAPGLLSAAPHQGGCLVVITSGATDLAALVGLRSRYSAFFVIALTSDGVPLRVVVPGARVLTAADAREAVRRWNEVSR
jgi:uncharacterized protein (DUF58 family)